MLSNTRNFTGSLKYLLNDLVFNILFSMVYRLKIETGSTLEAFLAGKYPAQIVIASPSKKLLRKMDNSK